MDGITSCKWGVEREVAVYTDGRRKVACNFRNGQMRKRKNSKGKLVSLASCDLLFHVASYLSISYKGQFLSILPSSCFFLFFFFQKLYL